MSNLRNMYSNYLYQDGEYRGFNAIELNILKAKGDKERFDNGKRSLLEKIIIDTNNNARDIIENYIKPLIDESAKAIDISRFKNRLCIEAKTNTRLIINTAAGLGKTVFEIGLNIHPLFSIPYIPSSSIKGSLRGYIYSKYYRDYIDKFNNEDKARDYANKKVEEVFGDQDKIGRLMILDAFPIDFEKRLVDGEVTTAIYGEEIEEHKVSPNPIIYPCIAKGVTFRFIVAFDSDELKKIILEYFKEMLEEGIGAKTLLGYGELR